MLPNTCQSSRTAIALAACLTLSGCEWLSTAQPVVVEGNGPRTVYSLGHLEPATGIIDIRATPGDRLQELHGIVENELAPENGILGYLSSYGMGKAQLNALIKKKNLAEQKQLHQVQIAEAQLAQANASKAQAQAKQTELELQQGKLDALKVASNLSAAEYQELEQLQKTDPDLVTQHQLDKQKNQMDLASQDYKIARESLASASAAADMTVLAADANIRAATTTVELANKNFEKLVIEQEIEVAKEVLMRSILLAPNASPAALRKLLNEDLDDQPKDNVTESSAKKPQYTVLKVSLRHGEVVTQVPIMQLGDLQKMVCIAEVYEADVKEIEKGQMVTIRSPAFWGAYADGEISAKTKKRSGGIRGRVDRIGRLVAPPGLSNRNPLAPADRSVVEVRIEIDTDDLESATAEPSKTDNQAESPMQHAAKHVGLQVTVEFDEKATKDNSKTREHSAEDSTNGKLQI